MIMSSVLIVIVIIMINALIIAHSHWSIFIGERGAVLFASEQLFLLVLGLFFLIVILDPIRTSFSAPSTSILINPTLEKLKLSIVLVSPIIRCCSAESLA